MSTSNPVPRLYRTVVDDVVKNVRESFLNEGVDEQVLQELKQLWENKLLQSRAIDFIPADASVKMTLSYPHTVQVQAEQSTSRASHASHTSHTSHTSQAAAVAPQASQLVQDPQTGRIVCVNHPTLGNVGQMSAPAAQAAMAIQGAHEIRVSSTAANPHIATLQHLQVAQKQPDTIQAFQVIQQPTTTIYANYQTRQAAQPQQESSTQQIIQQPATGRGPRVIYTQPIPDAPQLHTRRISQQPIQHTQQQLQHSQRTIQQQPVQHGQQLQHSQGAAPQQVRATVTALKQIIQVDGPGDGSSSDDDSDYDYDGIDHYPVNLEKKEGGDLSGEEQDEDDPLNSEDDVSDDETSDTFDTDNVVVCQYDKIARSKNRWKFHLKDGIMNLKQKDYVFHKATGEFDW